MKHCRPFTAAALLVTLGLAAFAQEENANEEKKTGFARFELVLQRNIFDPERRPPVQLGVRKTETPPPAHRIGLVGVYIDEEQRVALFAGSSGEYNLTLVTGESIAGFKVTSITTDNITLRKGDREIELRVGASLRKQGDEDWELSNETGIAAALPTSNADFSTTTVSPGGTDAARQEMLRKLIERRKQEVGR